MERPRVLIIGARGFVGTYAAEALSAKAEVVPGDRDNAGPGGVVIDIRDEASVNNAFGSSRPDAVLLFAAISNIDRCEAQPEEAFTVNVRGPEHVATACARRGIRLVFTSTGAVYDGKRQGYAEDDAVSPVSVYGETKVQAEGIVRALVPTAAIVRLSLVLGWARRQGTNSMLSGIAARWKAGSPVLFPVSEVRNPVHPAAVAEAMTALLIEHREAQGIYHSGASDAMTRYEIGCRLAAKAGVSADLVKAQTEPTPGRAPRGEHHFLLPWKLQRLLGIEAQTCEQVIEKCFV